MTGRYKGGELIDGEIVTYTDIHGWKMEEPFSKSVPVRGVESLPAMLLSCVKEGKCTFSVTKRERYGQYYLRKMVTHYVPTLYGYCATCAKTCFPKHQHHGLHHGVPFQWGFSGNFYCRCGAGEFGHDFDCYANPNNC